jgi:hypothetical protein
MVTNAQYVKEYTLLISFNDGHEQMVDFSEFLKNINTPYLLKYKKESQFKKFKIEHGNVAWGKDWDLVFPIDQLYSGVIKIQQENYINLCDINFPEKIKSNMAKVFSGLLKGFNERNG